MGKPTGSYTNPDPSHIPPYSQDSSRSQHDWCDDHIFLQWYAASVRRFPASSPCPGTGITFYGTVPPTPPDGGTSTSVFALDKSTAVTVTSPISALTQYNHVWYTAANLEDKEHTFLVNATIVDLTNPIWFDYLEYVPSNAASTSSASVPSSTSSSPTSTPPAHQSRNLETILPAVLVSATVFLFALSALRLWWDRRTTGSRGRHGGESCFERLHFSADRPRSAH